MSFSGAAARMPVLVFAAMTLFSPRRLVFSAIILLPTTALSQPHDFILRNGRVVDGTGNPSFHADIAVKNGRIAAIGKIAGSAAQEFDATNLVVAPGFIDVHTHAEDI
nr:hypothetical protein [Verrucomicrobiota bacterium]